MTSDDLVRSLVSDLKPVPRLRGVEQRALLWCGAALLYVLAGTYCLGTRADLAQRLGDRAYLYETSALAFLFLTSARSAFQLSVPGVEQNRVTRVLPILGLIGWFWLVASRSFTQPDVASFGWTCLWRQIFFALAPAVAAFVVLGKAAPLKRGWTGALAFLSASALAMLGTRMVCSKDDPHHVLAWHFVPVVIAALAGIGLGRWCFDRCRRTTP